MAVVVAQPDKKILHTELKKKVHNVSVIIDRRKEHGSYTWNKIDKTM